MTYRCDVRTAFHGLRGIADDPSLGGKLELAEGNPRIIKPCLPLIGKQGK